MRWSALVLLVAAGVGCQKNKVQLDAPALTGSYALTKSKGVVDELVLRSEGTYEHTTVRAGAKHVYQGRWTVTHPTTGSETGTQVTLQGFCADWLPGPGWPCPVAPSAISVLDVEVHNRQIFIALEPDSGLYYAKQTPLDAAGTQPPP